MKYSAYPAYKDSGVEWLGEIPEHWEVKRLKFIAYIQSGVAKGRDLGGRNIVELPYLRVANVQDGYLDLSDIAKITVGKDEVERYLLRAGDVLMNEGGDYDKLGRGAVWQGQIEPCIHQNHVYAVRPHKGIDPYWINTVTLTSYAKHYFILKSKQSTNLASISSTNLKELPVVIPPVSECKAIASFLDRETAKIDALIAKKERLIELLQEKRTAIISHAVTKGLDPTVPLEDSGVEWLGAIPAHWEVMPLKRSLKSSDYGLSDNIKGEGIFKVLTMGHIQDGKVLIPEEGSLDNVPKELVLEYDDLLFNRTNSRELVGKVGIFKGNSEDKVTFASYLVRLRSNDYAEPNYLNFLLNSQLILSKVRQDALLSINQANLNPTKYCQIRIPLPPTEEQHAIASYLDRETAKIDALISKIRQGIEKLQEYRTALISAAVTGTIDVREPTD
jgi:type I restriction enzyme S subunit